MVLAEEELQPILNDAHGGGWPDSSGLHVSVVCGVGSSMRSNECCCMRVVSTLLAVYPCHMGVLGWSEGLPEGAKRFAMPFSTCKRLVDPLSCSAGSGHERPVLNDVRCLRWLRFVPDCAIL